MEKGRLKHKQNSKRSIKKYQETEEPTVKERKILK